MEEIKFRAFHRKTKEWWYFDLNDLLRSEELKKNWYWLEQRSLYTGRKDKYGKEIYEGDIIDEETPSARRYQVRWVDDGFCLSIPPYHTRHFRDASHMKVIGNMVENPELWENTNQP